VPGFHAAKRPERARRRKRDISAAGAIDLSRPLGGGGVALSPAGSPDGVEPVDRVQDARKGDGRTVRDRVPGAGLSPSAAAAALRQLRRRGEAQLGQSSPTTVWRAPLR
jgi:hypothetical protein